MEYYVTEFVDAFLIHVIVEGLNNNYEVTSAFQILDWLFGPQSIEKGTSFYVQYQPDSIVPIIIIRDDSLMNRNERSFPLGYKG